MRRANRTMKIVTADAAIEKIQVDPLASENAAPEFLTKWNCRRLPMTST